MNRKCATVREPTDFASAFGVRWQAERDTAFGCAGPFEIPIRNRDARSAGALHSLQGIRSRFIPCSAPSVHWANEPGRASLLASHGVSEESQPGSAGASPYRAMENAGRLLPMKPMMHLLTRPGVVDAPRLPNRLAPGAGALGVLFWRLCRQNRNHGQLATGGRRLQKWKLTKCLLAGSGAGVVSCRTNHTLNTVKCAASLPYLANAGISTVFQQPAEAHQMKRIGTRAVLLRVLKRVGIDREKVSLAKSQVAVFALQNRLEHSRTTLVAVGHDRAATETGRERIGWSLHKQLMGRTGSRDQVDLRGR
jgi:hypothetical protein